MSETINLTITEQIEQINVTLTDELPINIGFYQVALPDPRVALARTEAEAAADRAEAAVASIAFSSTQTIADSGTIDTTSSNIKIIGDGAPVTTATTPLGTSLLTDGQIFYIVGTDDASTVTIPFSDEDYGALLNGDWTATRGAVLTLKWDLTDLRLYEVSRNN